MTQEPIKVEEFGCWWKVIGGPKNSFILILKEDFTKKEAEAMANQFLARHPSLHPIPFFYPGRSSLVPFKIGKEEIWTSMYWEIGLSISFELPLKDGKKIRTSNRLILPETTAEINC